MQERELNQLIDKYLNGTATTSEAKQVDDWYASFEDHQGLTSSFHQAALEQQMTESFRTLLAALKR